MRIITGSRRGRKLKTLEGLAVRPTPDRVKEALFNILQFNVEGRVFLDLFAGSGQIGLEALSRGASRAVFVDQSKASCAIIAENVKTTDFGSQSRIVNADYSAFLLRGPGPFDIAFLDPPYRTGILEKALAAVTPHMNRGGIVICEHPSDEALPEEAGEFVRTREYRYGKILLTAYRHKSMA